MPEAVQGADQAPLSGQPCSTELALINHSAKNVSFFTPEQNPPAGAARDPPTAPTLFTPLKLKGMELQNRIIVSPMCQYSASSTDAKMTMWHYQHLGAFAARGPGLVLTESTAVSPEGRISPQDLGLWNEAQLEALKPLVEFAHSQNVKFGVQLGHAGRKASTVAPWVDRKAAAKEKSEGWPQTVVGPSSIAYSKDTITPREIDKAGIEKVKADYIVSVRLALKAGVDTIEVHAAHGYLINQFLSPSSNHRTDKYGGSFENRVRILLELIDLINEELPAHFPLMVRIPGTDYLEYEPSIPQWTVDDAAKLGKELADKGVAFLDVTGGGTDARQKVNAVPGYQVPYAEAVRKAAAGTDTRIGTVGVITSAAQAQEILDQGKADAVLIGRPFLKDPNLVWHWAEQLKVPIHVPSQYGWGFGINRQSYSGHPFGSK